MQKFNSNTRIIVGVDHGYGNMKTAHRVFRTGVECMEEEPIVSKNFVKYKSKFYVIGESHLVYQGNKTDSEAFYILTLAAFAEELKFRGLHEANVIFFHTDAHTKFVRHKALFQRFIVNNLHNIHSPVSNVRQHIHSLHCS
mgnify:CR=1 FL=1